MFYIEGSQTNNGWQSWKEISQQKDLGSARVAFDEAVQSGKYNFVKCWIPNLPERWMPDNLAKINPQHQRIIRFKQRIEETPQEYQYMIGHHSE